MASHGYYLRSLKGAAVQAQFQRESQQRDQTGAQERRRRRQQSQRRLRKQQWRLTNLLSTLEALQVSHWVIAKSETSVQDQHREIAEGLRRKAETSFAQYSQGWQSTYST